MKITLDTVLNQGAEEANQDNGNYLVETDRQKEGYQTKLWRDHYHLSVAPTRR